MVVWTGASGAQYDYEVYELGITWNDVPGNYIFAKTTPAGWQAIYMGETGSFKDRIPNHEVWPCARRYGVTHIHAHTNGGGVSARQSEEMDLRKRYRPPCNG